MINHKSQVINHLFIKILKAIISIKREFYDTKRGGRNLELAFRESLKKMRGTKSKEKFSQELEMSRSNYSRIESGKSDPTIKTLEQIAKLTNSTLVVDLIPNEPTEPEPETEQVTLELEMEEEKSNDFV